MEEAVIISYGLRDNILNSKKEFLGETLPRLQIEVKDRIKQTDYNGMKLEPIIPKQKRSANGENIQTKSIKRSRTQTEPQPALELVVNVNSQCSITSENLTQNNDTTTVNSQCLSDYFLRLELLFSAFPL